jgi:hypothetical protein
MSDAPAVADEITGPAAGDEEAGSATLSTPGLRSGSTSSPMARILLAAYRQGFRHGQAAVMNKVRNAKARTAHE